MLPIMPETTRMRLILISTILVTVINCVMAMWSHSFLGKFDGLMRMSRSFQTLEEQWFSQYLNHFNPADNRVWKQRYFVSDKYYEKNGPIFLYFGGEEPISEQWLRQGQMFDEAKRYGAMMFTIEHRFYGKSLPTDNLSVENLTYLNAQQVLLDTAYFIEGMNKAHKLPKDTKWIMFGCSYAGSLAAWMRAKYPHLVHGAVSGSAPVLAKVDFSEFMIVLEDSLRTHSQACVDVVSNATREVEIMAKSALGRKKLRKLLKLCDPFESKSTTKNDIVSVYEKIVGIFAFVVQLNDFHRFVNNISIDKVCDILVDEKKGDPIDRLSELTSIILNSRGEECLDYKYSNTIDELRNITSLETWRQWLYQSCTEFGFYLSSSAKSNLFGNRLPIDFYRQRCIDVFGPQFAKIMKLGAERTNLIFGGLDLSSVVSNVVFVNGNIDPWYPLGITKSSNPKAPAIFINGTSHCATVYPVRKNDLPQLVEARREMSRLIGQWLND